MGAYKVWGLGAVVLATALLAAAPAFAAEDMLLSAMKKELDRSFTKLKNAGEAPLYFLGYRVYDTRSIDLVGDYGALMTGDPESHTRTLDVELRVGSPRTDNTHKLRGGFHFGSMRFLDNGRSLMPLEDDEAAVRAALWEKTDAAFKTAQDNYNEVKTDKDVRVSEEDTSDDFSQEKPVVYIGEPKPFDVDRTAWEARVRKLSALFRNYANIKQSSVHFTANKTVRYLVSSEGTKIEDEHIQYRVFATADAIADDGMEVWLYDGVEAASSKDIPDDAKLEEMVNRLAKNLEELRVARVAEPYAGPAILRNRAAGVFFHEIFGHRIEGHRQKDETEGRTFAKKVGMQIMPAFISVYDDPTRERLGNKPLNGYYQYDDEGVPAQRVVLVDRGVLKNFLMGRSPVKGFNNSNGHGRSAPGRAPVARQGNLIVDSTNRVPYEKLRAMLIEELKKQNKPYGLIFDEIAGGFTMTQSYMPQVFKLKPLRVWKVFADGRPDELMRGADLVGTPLASIERIRMAGDDDDTFNGSCGAESGFVPVAAVSPSLLVETIEVERQRKDQEKPPLLPPPMAENENSSHAEKKGGAQ